MTWEEAVEHINSVSRYGNRPGAECTKALLARLGNPERELKVIHIAGTNGKGSVCMYIAGMLRSLGLNTGVFTSPHLIRENERIRFNDELISDEDFTDCFEKVHRAELELLKDGFGQISYFDFFVGIAMLYYAMKKPDVVILETGLGGRLDSTNAVESPVMTVITSISLDHVAILGDTVEKIAAEKAGIIKHGAPVVYVAGQEYSHVIEEKAEAMGIKAAGVEKSQCEIHEIGSKHIDFSLDSIYYKDNVFRLATPAVYQVMNAALAMTAVQMLVESRCFDRIAYDSMDRQNYIDRIRRGLESVTWEGRMEQVCEGFYIDGAHNPDGIAALLDTAAAMKKNTRGHYVLMFSAVNDKDYSSMIKEICDSNIFDEYVITQIEGARCLDVSKIADTFRRYTDGHVNEEPDVGQAVKKSVECFGGNATVICAGSLYLAGEVRKVMLDNDRF
ncbi:bifunctional folylpolyglutamate synthase/dihydrofolate synthase [[Bacteroides] pectinophilus]|uniref:tetrahydrofolate synthase n=1 Tax=[Bacteroides] pectinophilus ATCC 43243 TaxID=483218 RepID=B7ARH5_9FIRM|nr:bifunctional protein FolC [[Bacteroides] pectinophilus ATCC 43243]UWN95282.1 bifunctional folylpolyglutamate synthase/dihydrofolate synthase [[Bacteroides] pectinophilus]